MLIDEARQRLEAVEPLLADRAFAVVGVFARNGRPLHLAVTDRLRRAARRARVWNSPALLTALKNGEYGFDPTRVRSAGGRDGIFLVDRDFWPPNEMMRKIFDRYLDKPDSGVEAIAAALGTSAADLRAARLVSHHFRLLGVLWCSEGADWLVLVDFDRSD